MSNVGDGSRARRRRRRRIGSVSSSSSSSSGTSGSGSGSGNGEEDDNNDVVENLDQIEFVEMDAVEDDEEVDILGIEEQEDQDMVGDSSDDSSSSSDDDDNSDQEPPAGEGGNLDAVQEEPAPPSNDYPPSPPSDESGGGSGSLGGGEALNAACIRFESRLMPRIEGKGEFGQARGRVVYAPQIATQVEVQLGKRLQFGDGVESSGSLPETLDIGDVSEPVLSADSASFKLKNVAVEASTSSTLLTSSKLP